VFISDMIARFVLYFLLLTDALSSPSTYCTEGDDYTN
jgi:hypothetical protein